jgi:hypothetical protein
MNYLILKSNTLQTLTKKLKLLKKDNFNFENLSDEDCILFATLKEYPSTDIEKIKNFIIRYVEKHISNTTFLEKYISRCGFDNFCFDRYEQYCLKIKNKLININSDEYFKLAYGDNWHVIKKQQNIKRPSPYDPNYISIRDNISLEEAKEFIKKYKKDKATSKDGFIKRHGEKIGLEKFEKFQETSKVIAEKYSEDDWNRISLLRKTNNKRYKEYYINKGYSEVEAIKLSSEFQINNSGLFKQFYINNGYSDKEINDIFQEINKKKDSSSLNFFMRKYKTNCLEKYSENVSKKIVHFGKASKKSLVYFDKLYQILLEKNINDKDIYFGSENKKEYFLRNNKAVYMYDFTIKSLKIILEYHGEAFHPNKNKLNETEWNIWQHPYTKKPANEVYKKDQHKKQIAIDNGFTYIELWSFDTEEENWNKINNMLGELK